MLYIGMTDKHMSNYIVHFDLFIPTISLMSISLYLAAFFSNSMTRAALLLNRAWYISDCAALAAATASAEATCESKGKYNNNIM